MTEKKKQRLEEDRLSIITKRRLLAVQAYRNFLANHPPDTIHPPKLEVICTEAFRAVIEDTPASPEEVTEEIFAAAILQVPQFSIDWKQSKDQSLVKIMKEFLPEAVEADLHLAPTFFSCSATGTGESTEAIAYPRILVHAGTSYLKYNEPKNDGIDETLKLCLRQDSWNAHRMIRFHRLAFRNIESVVEACGLDPDVTTTAEMDEINPLMECLTCSNETDGRLVMRWMAAVSCRILFCALSPA